MAERGAGEPGVISVGKMGSGFSLII